MSATVVFASSILGTLFDQFLTNTVEKPLLVDEEDGALGSMPLFLNQLTMLGGAPNIGKSSLLGQIFGNFLRKNPVCTALIANVEMYPEDILKRIISSIAGVDLSMNREMPLADEEMLRIKTAMPTIEAIAGRLLLMPPPITMRGIAETINQHNPTLVGVDYLQRVDIGDGSSESSERLNTNKKMSLFRQFTPGRHIISVSALSRSAGQGGSNYKAKNLNMASFRESSEVEYACDSAYILTEDDEARNQGYTDRYILNHVKSRYTERKNIPLVFNGACHRWSKPDADGVDDIAGALANPSSLPPSSSKETDLQRKLQGLWSKHSTASVETM